MDVAIISSNNDPASVNVRNQLLAGYDFKESGNCYTAAVGGAGGSTASIYSFDREMIFLEGIDKSIEADVFIFASRHVSKAGVDAFTVHAPGNWGKAEFGGLDRTLCTAPAGLMKAAFRELQSNTPGMEVIQEATHHGPCIGKPCMFIEIGSNEQMYKNEEAGKTVADAIINAIHAVSDVNKSGESGGISRLKSAVGIGGPHHCPNFKRIMLETEISVAHVCPKYALEILDEEMLRQAMEKTEPKAGVVVLDWKGLGGFKDKVKGLVEDAGIECLRTDDF